MKDVCIGIDSHVTDACSDADGFYSLRGMRERLYIIDVTPSDTLEIGTSRSFPLFVSQDCSAA